MSSSSGNSKLLWSILVPIVYLILITIIILGYLDVLHIPSESILIIVYVGLGFTALLVIAIVLQKVYKNKSKKNEESSSSLNLRATPQLQSRTTQQYQTIAKEETFEKPPIRNLEALQVTLDDDQETNCGICKLEIRKHQQISTCPQCGTLFHKEHLGDWLQKEDKCPVCGFNIKEYLEGFNS
ncbi:MAG: RING finger protein [Candidatus Thorarchaeota archaeon]